MDTHLPLSKLSKETLQKAIAKESDKFQEFYRWIEGHMPQSFFEEVDQESIIMIVHSLMSFDVNDYFSTIHFKHSAFTLSLDSPDSDLTVLKHFRGFGIKNFRTFISNTPPPFSKAKVPLRIARLLFIEYVETVQEPTFTSKEEKVIFSQVKARNPEVKEEDFKQVLQQMSPMFLRSLTSERLSIALDMFYRAKTRDHCQYEVRYNEEWKQKKTPSLQIVFAWRNVPRFDFLYRMAKMIHRHHLAIRRINVAHIDPYSAQNILVMSFGLHGSTGKAAWEEADLSDFLKEFVTLKSFEGMPAIEETFIETRLLTGNQANLLKSLSYFVHQALVHTDVNMYAHDHIEEGLCRHPELIVQLIEAFEAKFHPEKSDFKRYQAISKHYLELVDAVDTGNELNDTRRKNILKQAMNMVDFTLKTNFYRNNKTAHSFRLDPHYMDHLPYDRTEKFPELPYAIFFIQGLNSIGFHVRFRDLSRGGLRTILPQREEQMLAERNNVFSECYNLAYTQNKKNKDIPEGGAKGVIFLEPDFRFVVEEEMMRRELEATGQKPENIERTLKSSQQATKLEYLYQAQRSYIDSLLTLINCESTGKLRAKHIIDYWGKPEYIYLGPDENMHNVMIEWIAAYSKFYDYKPGGAFISSKPGAGINHKEYGVTSLGVNVYMEEALKFLGIDPKTQPFTIKMTGGPDGDVAGNQMYNLFRLYPKTAKLLATIDVSGTIFDPKGLDLKLLEQLFQEGKPLRFYPPDKLNDGGFLLDAFTKKEQTAYAQQTLLYRKVGNKLIEEWLSGNEMNHLLRHNVHSVKADIFIPGGGRPRTLNESNIKEFLDEKGEPTARAIIEGANLYLTPLARRFLENLGVLIFKDSSSNKGGVICSSFEVLSSLALSEEEFLKEKKKLVEEILEIIQEKAREEGKILLKTHGENNAFLTDLSEQVSERINLYKDQLNAYLGAVSLSKDPKDPLTRCLLNYCPPLLRKKYQNRILEEVPDVHKKAVIACHIASRLVYYRGLDWSPSLIDVLPLVVNDPVIVGDI